MHEISAELRQRVIAEARRIAEPRVNDTFKPNEHLRSVANRLDVRRIEAGAIRSLGFLEPLDSGGYAIYYSKKATLNQKRYTIAHEIGHLVVEQSIPHIQKSAERGGQPLKNIERLVDRVAAEVIMPANLVESRIVELSRKELDPSYSARYRKQIRRRYILCNLMNYFCVSESAMVLRLLELPNLLAVLVRAHLSGQGDKLSSFTRDTSEHDRIWWVMKNRSSAQETVERVVAERTKSTVHQFCMGTAHGLRKVSAEGWIRCIKRDSARCWEYWVIGWSWDRPEIVAYDDAIPMTLDHRPL